MSDKAEIFRVDGGATELTGYKVAEVRQNGYAIMVVACAFQDGGCHALHMHLLVEDEDGGLTIITTLDSENNEAVARSGFLVRALLMLVHGVLDASLFSGSRTRTVGSP